jgi:hypothetical protein
MNIQIVLNLKTRNNADVIAMANRYVANLKGNSLLNSAAIVKQTEVVKTLADALSDLMCKPVYEAKAANLRVSRENLDRELTILAGQVEAVANSSSTIDSDRIGIVESVGMDIKTYPSRSKRVFAVTNGNISGSVKLVAEGGARAHEWQYTSDLVNFTNRIAAQTTVRGSSEITGLSKGVYAFFHKPIYSDRVVDWEGPIINTVV